MQTELISKVINEKKDQALIKIDTVSANFNNTRHSLILNNQRNLQALDSCGSPAIHGHDIRFIYIKQIDFEYKNSDKTFKWPWSNCEFPSKNSSTFDFELQG